MTSWTCFDVNSGDLGAFKSIYLLFFEKYSKSTCQRDHCQNHNQVVLYLRTSPASFTLPSLSFFLSNLIIVKWHRVFHCRSFFFWRGRICQDCF